MTIGWIAGEGGAAEVLGVPPSTLRNRMKKPGGIAQPEDVAPIAEYLTSAESGGPAKPRLRPIACVKILDLLRAT